MADDGIGLLDALEIERAHVFGISMGGVIVQQMAIRHPDRLLSMTSMMSSCRTPWLPGATERSQELSAIQPTTRDEFIDYYAEWETYIGGARYPRSDAYLRQRAAEMWDRGIDLEAKARQREAIMATPPWGQALEDVQVPSLVIHGSEDPLLPLAHGLDTHERLPNATKLIIEGWGHGYPAESLWPLLVSAVVTRASSATD